MALPAPPETATVSARPRRGLRAVLTALGPGLLFAIASMGSSHFLLAPIAGASFGYALAWTILLAHAVKYPAFEYATRYTVATGENLLEGFRKLPGPKGWAVWLFVALAGLQSVTIVAGVVAVCAAVVLAAFPQVSLGLAVVGIAFVASLLLWFGAYRGLERISVGILALVTLFTIVAAVVARPDFGALAVGSVLPVVPAGAAAALLIGGLLGYMPAPLELAVLESLWYEQRGVGGSLEERRARLRVALLDFRVGYVVSVFLGLLLVALGAALLFPRGLVPAGTSVFATIAEIYRSTLGDSVVPIYLLGAFLGMFATSYAVLDGFPRGLSASFAALGRPARRTERGRELRYWFFLYAVFLLGLGVVLLVPDPARLVSLAATGTVLVGPLWYAMITLVVHRLPEPFRPSRTARVVAWAGFAGMVATAVYVAYVLYAYV